MQDQDQLNQNKPVAVPDVLLARPLAVARSEAGLTPRLRPRATPSFGPGLRGEPCGRLQGRQGSTVTLTVSTGHGPGAERRRPGRQQAVATLAQLGLDPNIDAPVLTAQSDTVTAQQPHAGDRVPKGTAIGSTLARRETRRCRT
jgi:hypothetical protein